MRNPWAAKNPFMSMWLSAANKALATSQGLAKAGVKREVAALQGDVARHMADFWGAKSVARKKTRR